MLLKELWPNITINGYHTIKPLTGTLDAIPSKYKDLNFANFDDWFKTFALRAQNDCNMYLDFIFNKWEFTTFPDEIKETVIDMIYILIEHWVFNRVPVEFFVDATNNLNTSSTSYIASTLANNTQDMIPQRVKALANFTELKNFLIPYNDENTVDANMIDLGLYYSKFVVDKLLEKEKNERLKKQLKFFQSRCQDYTCPQNPNLRGPVTNLVIEEYASSDYEHETETLTVSFPKQIGTLPPNALQPNPQEGDYTHTTTADFSAKLQKQLNLIFQNFQNIQKSLIGAIAWFSQLKKLEEGWLPLSEKAYTVILADGSQLVTPSLREGDFVRHKKDNPLNAENDNVGHHIHPIYVAPKLDKPNSSFVFKWKKNYFFSTTGWNVGTMPHTPEDSDIVMQSSLILDAWPKEVPEEIYLFFSAETEKNETDILETRPQNTSLIAHIYVGLEAKIK
ncbi:hypothetical protein [Spiroplasma endosymbiont of Calodromius spilotus]|uniref:hypothetical protein n=1 Tax=Spiroplasma endosymbiont of Calodromius spilotus TaxID=3077929 RepID=UPI0031FED42A